MKVYVSGPMTGLPDFNFPAFHAAKTRLQTAGYDVVSPADVGVRDGWEWADYLRHDLRLLLDCDAIVTLPGWQQSKGASLECHVAAQLGMPLLSLFDALAEAAA